MVRRAHINPLYIVWVVSNVPMATSGSSWRIRFTGQPLNCHHSVQNVLTMQNHMKKQKKNIWLILLTVMIFTSDPYFNPPARLVSNVTSLFQYCPFGPGKRLLSPLTISKS